MATESGISDKEVKELMNLDHSFINDLIRYSHVNLTDQEEGFGGLPLESMHENDYSWIMIMQPMWRTLKSEKQNVKDSIVNYFDAVTDLKRSLI